MRCAWRFTMNSIGCGTACHSVCGSARLSRSPTLSTFPMLIDSSAIVEILARRPLAGRLLARLDAAAPPFFVTPLGLFDAVEDLARAKSGAVSTDARRQAREAVAEFVAAVGAKEIPISADLGRRAIDIGIAEGGSGSLCFALACSRAYRTPLLTAEDA